MLLNGNKHSQIKIRNDTFFFQNKRLSTRSNARQYTSHLEFLQALNTLNKKPHALIVLLFVFSHGPEHGFLGLEDGRGLSRQNINTIFKKVPIIYFLSVNFPISSDPNY